MPLIDGKYEILREEHSGQGQSYFEASSPDGTVLRIVWFEVTPEQERSFEQYRRGLRKLMKSGHAAVHDVVARPGAHYVAWYLPQGSRLTSVEPELNEVLEAAGFEYGQADIRRSGRQSLIYDLSWDGAGLSQTPLAAGGEQQPGAEGPPRRSSTLPQSTVSNAVALAILLLAATALLGSWYQRGSNAFIAVADVRGERVNAAMQQLASSGLRSVPIASSSDEEPGTVVATAPAAGELLAHGETVQVEYAFPVDEVRPLVVPGLAGLEWPAEVETALQGTQLEAGRISLLSSGLPEGTVLSQSEPAGSTVAEGTPLNLLISSGEPVPTAVLPDLSGLELADALEEALSAGLEEAQLSILQVTDTSVRPGSVVAQDPPADQEFELEGARLSLEVARGDPDMEPLESFLGMSLPLARASAQQFDIQVTEVSDTDQPQGVIGQEPAPGSYVDGGTLVLTVNVHPRVVPLPVPEIEIRDPGERPLAYNWFIEPGIPQVTARVYATSLAGQEQLVAQQSVSGGEWVQGTFDTSEPMVTFRLTLNGDAYGEQQRSQ